jgi:L-lactate dehydrogenase complex protein LldG
MSREAILGRIREATRDVPAGEPPAWNAPPRYARSLDLPHEAIVDRFAERVADYRAQVVRCSGDDAAIAAALSAAVADHGASQVGVPPDLPEAWLGDYVSVTDGPGEPFGVDELDALDGVITGSALAIAETGTIVLDAGPGQGRRALTLVPDLHLCVVRAADVVGTVPEAFDRLAGAPRDGRPITFVSGPSATSDIELNRVEGVHGPRRLVVVLAG